MKAYELFGVIVRAFGVWILIQAALTIAAIGTPLGVVVLVMEIALGFYLLFKADMIVGMSYQRLPPSDFDPLVSR